MDEGQRARQGEDKCLTTPTWIRGVAGQQRKRSDGLSKKQSSYAKRKNGRSGSTRTRRVAGQKKKQSDAPSKKQSSSHAYRASMSLAYLAST
jgi:hypothetical protein